ncbi:TPA: hypothetical protein LP447_001181 [Enterococcus faecium]|uniref:hypothetical protein n=1 Tax=Enterococcus mundtii TaxID=53346 RepID=UPI00188414E0|nr:hypothetical protein [Enterococcus casseliflavus]HBL2025558.1 hypothetical protein [Enterococcus faecium]
MKHVWILISTPTGDDPSPAIFSSRKKAEKAFWDQVKYDQRAGLKTETTADNQNLSCVSTIEKTGDQMVHDVKRVKVH